MRSRDVHDRTIAVRDTALKTPPKPVRRSGISPDDDSRNRAPAHLKEGMLGRRMQPTTPDWRSRKSTKVARRPGRFLPVAQVLRDALSQGPSEAGSDSGRGLATGRLARPMWVLGGVSAS